MVSIVIEGLDGIGKSTLIDLLATKINAKILNYIPEIMKPFKTTYLNVNNIEEMKTYLTFCNLLTSAFAEELTKNGNNIVFDRYYPSTIAYCSALGKQTQNIEHHNEFLNIFKPSYIFVLTMNENDRIERLNNRCKNLNCEPTTIDHLINNTDISVNINYIYKKNGCIEIVVDKNDSSELICNKIIDFIVKQESYNHIYLEK